MNIEHQAYKDLVRNNAIDRGTLELFSSSVRDSELVKVFRCLKSGVIFLDKILASNSEYYSGQSNLDYWNKATLLTTDDNRRARDFKSHFSGKHCWTLDAE